MITTFINIRFSKTREPPQLSFDKEIGTIREMEKTRNHKNYGSALIEFLNENPGAPWGDAISFLMNRFNWSQKTSANRLFELRKLNLIRVEGNFTRMEIGKAMKDERRIFTHDTSSLN